MFSQNISARINRIDKTNLRAIALMGSYARGEAKKYSDIDIVCFLKENVQERPPQIKIIDQKYLVVSFVSFAEVESWFTLPEQAVKCILGLRYAKPIWDPNDCFVELQKRAIEFRWNDSFQLKANMYASKNLLSWVEEVHKALQGVLLRDTGRMLNGLHGLTFGLFHVVSVQRGILLFGDNSFFEQVTSYFGKESEFSQLSREAFGVEVAVELSQRVVAGLRLFCLVVDLLVDVLTEDEKVAVLLVKEEINRELGF